MKEKYLVGFIIILLHSINTLGQQTIKGKILNGSTQEPIVYANIGLRKSNVGTISNQDGSFSLYIPANLPADTLLVSSIGFGTKQIPINYLLQKKGATIYLIEKPVTLTPVIINSKKEKLKTFELGNADFKGGVLQTDTLYTGRSISF